MNLKSSDLFEKKYSLLFYDHNKAPRYFEIDKTLCKFFLYGLPCLALIMLIISFLQIIYLKDLPFFVANKESAHYKILKKKNISLENSLIKISEQFKLLKENYKEQAPQFIDNFTSLHLFQIPAGSQDLSKVSELQLKNIKTRRAKGQIQVTFELHNKKPLAFIKRRGQLFIFGRTANTIHLFPKDLYSSHNLKISHTSGVPFLLQRFKVVTASFSESSNLPIILFQVIIFSKMGDLIYYKIIRIEKKTI